MKKTLLLILTLALIISVPACEQKASGSVIQSDKPRNTSPTVDKADLEKLVDGNNAFAFDLYQVLGQTGGNLFASTYSISEALAMTYAGARGSTETGMAKALKFTLPQERLHTALNSLDLQLKQRGKVSKGKEGKEFRLNIVNALWAQKGTNFLGPFLDTLAGEYGAGMRILDFANETEPSRTAINEWVSNQTEKKIKDLIPPGTLGPQTQMVLTNATYFKATWQYPFDTKATASGVFHTLKGGDTTVPMMRQTDYFRYTEGANYQAIELPYEGREMSMVILLPRPGQFESFEKSLNATVLKEFAGKPSERRVALTMPKFEYTSTFSLKNALTVLGMGVAFTDNADLSGMNGKGGLKIQDALHKAFVSVDESGTEAAAATAVIMAPTAIPVQPPPVEFKVDRPFIFLIRDITTGNVIFIGRVLNPAAK